MPFSWKSKTRRNRFSQLVADQLQSPKRGASFVLETGFPTSLIDLYVRNRGRFRKSSAKKQSSTSPVDSINSSFGDTDCTETNKEGVVVVGSEFKIDDHSKVEVDTSVEMVKLSPVIVTALKVLLMAVLFFQTKRFTIAITFSAFLLLFMELVAKWLLRRSVLVTPNAGLKTTLVCELEIEEEVESKKEVRLAKELELESDEVGRSEGLVEIRRKSSRRAIMKSKIKKLVFTKLHKSSVDLKLKVCSEFKEEEERVVYEKDVKVKPLVRSNECSGSKGEIVVTERRSLAYALSSKIECVDEELGRDLEQNSGGLILLLVVLVGLIGGRVLALVIVLSWCLMVNMLQLRNVKFPIS